MLLVLDTDVIVSGLRSPTGASHRLLELLNEGQFILVVSVALVLEYEAVLKRPQHLKAMGLTMDQIDDFISGILVDAKLIPSFFSWRPSLHDPNDEMVLETAINGQADAIITFNTRHIAHGATQFGIDVSKPGDFLGRIVP